MVKLEGWQVNIVVIPHYLIWYVDFMNICNTWWGASRTLKLVSSRECKGGGLMVVGQGGWDDGRKDVAGGCVCLSYSCGFEFDSCLGSVVV